MARQTKPRKKWSSRGDEFLEIAAVLSPDVATAEIYARIAQALEVKGTPIPENAIWIAAVHWNAKCRSLNAGFNSPGGHRSV
jgi:predicted nucleic acid-binding protein